MPDYPAGKVRGNSVLYSASLPFPDLNDLEPAVLLESPRGRRASRHLQAVDFSRFSRKGNLDLLPTIEASLEDSDVPAGRDVESAKPVVPLVPLGGPPVSPALRCHFLVIHYEETIGLGRGQHGVFSRRKVGPRVQPVFQATGSATGQKKAGEQEGPQSRQRH
jgi:hypothetical protein